MKKIAASKFKEKCLSILEEVDETGVVITKHGRPIARLVAYRQAPADLIGSLSGSLKIKGDIESTGVRWDAQP